MSLGICFWVLMIITLVFGFIVAWPLNPKLTGPGLLVFILLALLGWKVFGPALHG
jgi:hypothetical protein